MWYDIFKFELQYRMKRPDTYIYFIFLFLFSLVGVDFIFQGSEMGLMKKNSPLVIAKTMGAITGLFMILASMIMGVAVLRDFEYEIESLVFSKPINKKDYLLGRFLGSFAILLFAFTGILFGMILGEFMPWHDQNELLSFNAFVYVKTFLMTTIPTIFFGASLFFVTGALSRNLVVVYTQGIILFVVFMLTKAITNEFWQAVLDPFSLTTTTFATSTWSTMEKSTQNIPFNGILLYNKMFWIVLGIIALVYGYKKFTFNIVKEKSSKRNKRQTIAHKDVSDVYDNEIPQVNKQYGFISKWTQLKQFSWFYFLSICKQPSFWGIAICGMIIILINSVNLGTVYDVDSYPATYFIVEELQETSIYFFIIILVFYSGELIWKERSAKLNLIYDATSMSSFMNLLGKYIGLNLVYIVLMLTLILSGIIFQTMSSYYQYEFKVYFYGFFLEILPFLGLYTLIAFLIQSIVNNKFVGIMLAIVTFIFIVALGMFGFDHPLYLFGGNSLAVYSDMNGYGHFLKPYLLIKAYWYLFGILLLILASLLMVRGTETSIKKRLKALKNRMSKPLLILTSILIIAFISIGSYIYYNTNVVNKYWTNTETTNFRVAYEKALKKYEYLPQPKIVRVNINVELYPSQRNYKAEGYYILKNTNDITINEVHIQKLIEDNIVINDLSFEGGAIINEEFSKFDYSIHQLKSPLQPGDSVKMNFKQTYVNKGFPALASNTSIIENGTFFKNEDFPTIGYSKKYELQDVQERMDFQLPERVNKASREDVYELQNSRAGGDSDGINFEIIVGTEKDQTAIAPGDLLKKWEENDRNYFHYKMNEKMMNFYAIVSARYEVKKDVWIPKSDVTKQPVKLEIHYHKGHEYNLERMMRSMKASFDYYDTNFSPYQYHHMRIMEFPRYAQFAQSFPGTVPFSESIGFVLDINDDKDVDMAFYITAHELAHQWFGMQVAAANVKGKHLILETLSQYAALMVLKKTYPEEKIQQFLKLQQDKYKDGKQRRVGEEPSLAIVENQEYVYYAKGALAMYQLQKMIGEEKVNEALRLFIKDWNSMDGRMKKNTINYATTHDLLGYFKSVTPRDLQFIITDLFESAGELTIDKS